MNNIDDKKINNAIKDVENYIDSIKENPFTLSQKKAILHVGNCIESAGAGCGKTSVLVEKICQFIRVGLFKINEIIVMTFTNNATNEMKSRIKLRLNDLYLEEKNNEYKSNINQAILSINSANISTIDALCKKIVNTNFEKLGDIPINSRIADETELKVLMYQVFDEVIEDNCKNEKYKNFFKSFFNKNADSIKDDLLYEGMKFIYNFAWPSDFFDIDKKHSKIEEEYKDLLKECYKKYEKKKIEKCVIAISDLAHLALKVLYDKKGKEKKFTSVSENLQHKTKYLFVDEYQDTSYVQEELIKAINGNFNIVNTFLVGDIKQSIYRFRNSRVEFFKEKTDEELRKKLDYNIDIIKTNDNFRSDPHIINFVNSFFENFMTEEICGIDYNKDHALIVPESRNINNDNNKVEINILHKYVSENKDEEIKVNKNVEADFIAKRIKDLIKENQNYTYNDIVILHRSPSTIVKDYEKSFRKYGIPLTYEKKSGFYDSYEIRLLMAFLNIIDNPMQDIYLVSVLNTGIFKVSLDDIAIINSLKYKDDSYYSYIKKLVNEYRNNDNNTYKTNEAKANNIISKYIDVYKRVYDNDDYEKLINKLEYFLNVLNSLIEKSRYKSASDIVEEIFNEVDLIEYVCGLDNHETGKENLLYFLELARRVNKSAYRDIYNFNIYLDSLVKKKADLGEADLASDVPKVRIITIHKSKGMQYPVVILPYLTSKLDVSKHNSNSKTVYFTHKEGLSLNKIDIENRKINITDERKRIVYKEREEILEEYMRLLYVATTRPKDKLICSITSTSKEIDLFKEKKKKNEDNDNDQYINKRNLYGNLVFFDEGTGLMVNFAKVLIEYLRHVKNFIKDESSDDTYDDSMYHNDDIVLKISSGKKINEYIKDESFTNTDNYLNVDTTDEYIKEHNIINNNGIKPKYSVSEIKLSKNEKFDYYLYNRLKDINEDNDKNIKEVLSGSELGNVYHEFMSLYNFDDDMENTLSKIILADKIPDKSEFLNKINKALSNDVCKHMKKAFDNNLLFREQRFMKNFNIKEVYDYMDMSTDEDIDENVIVQGVIDCFYINSDDEIVLIDYKTDFMNKDISIDDVKEKLTNMYSVQLDIYARSIGEITGKKIAKKYIYSFKIDDFIEL